MAKRNEIFPSKYLKASDLAGKPLEVEIKDAPTETLGSGSDAETKTVLYFRNGVKPLPLNMTNWDAVAAIAGDDTNDWPGHRVGALSDHDGTEGQGCRLHPHPRTAAEGAQAEGGAQVCHRRRR